MNREMIIIILVVVFWNIFCMWLYIKEQKRTNNVINKKRTRIYFASMLIANLVLTIMIKNVYTENSLLFLLKRIGMVTLLWIIAKVDIKEHRIPNLFLVAGIAFRVGILVAELIWERQYIMMTLVSEGIAMAIVLFLALVCMLIMKNSIGAGDVKLMLLMSLLQGTIGVGASLFASMLVSFLVAIFLLATNKKSRKDVIPLGPCILVGTFLSVFLIGA